MWPFLLFLIAGTLAETLHYTISERCTNRGMNDILQSQVHCQLKDTLIDLTSFESNMSIPREDVIHVLPNFVHVKRCGGNCARTSHRCIPARIRKKQVPVMLVMSMFPHGIHETHCGHVEVDEHESCECDCPITPADCISPEETFLTSKRFFDPKTCRCKCKDPTARRSCLARAMHWDEDNCKCMCPPSQWKMCSTGFIFDFGPKCHCTPADMTASLGLIAALVVLILCMFVSLVGGYFMYRKKTGLFKRSATMSRQELSEKRAFFEGKNEAT